MTAAAFLARVDACVAALEALGHPRAVARQTVFDYLVGHGRPVFDAGTEAEAVQRVVRWGG